MHTLLTIPILRFFVENFFKINFIQLNFDLDDSISQFPESVSHDPSPDVSKVYFIKF